MVYSNFLDSYDPINVGEIPLLFQTGYLTIKNKDIHDKVTYTLGIPKLEVKESLFGNLLKVYTDKTLEEIQEMTITEQLKNKDTEGLKESINIRLSNIPYKIHENDEKYYHSVFLVCL
ncbi:MAG: hypothetical protein LBC39_03405 [Methanobrevibacter sp.]|jgi:hypothetical protein|nr:hypothetical protein [Candidatus Methanovirga aequatorialis]